MGKCLQIIFLFINLVVFLGGACLTALSIWLVVDPTSIIDLVNKIPADDKEIPDAFLEILLLVKSVLYFALVMGILMVLVGFLGCCGSAKRNICMLNLFAGIVLVVILAEVAVVVMSFVYYPRVDNFMQQRMDTYNTTSTATEDIFNKEFVDSLQTIIKCCGWQSFEDYNSTLPATCCEELNSLGCTTPQYDHGCKEGVKKGMTIIGGVVVGCVLIQLISIISACVITKKDKNFD